MSGRDLSMAGSDRTLAEPRRLIEHGEASRDMAAASLRDILRTLLRRRWPMIGIMLGAVLCSLAYLLLESSTYTASTRVLVRVGRDKLTAVATADNAPGSFVFSERPENVNDGIEIFASPAVLERSFPVLRARLEEMRANAPPPPPWRQRLDDARASVSDLMRTVLRPVRQVFGVRELTGDEALVEEFRRAISAAPIKETSVFVAAFRWSDPTFAAFAMNTILDSFLLEHVRVMSASRDAADFYRGEAARIENELQGVAATLTTYGRDNRLTDPTAEKQVVLGLIASLEREIATAQVAQEQTRRRIDDVRRQYADGTAWPSTPGIPQVTLSQMSDLDARFAELLNQRSLLLRQMLPTSRDVRLLDEQIGALRLQKRDALLGYLEDRLRADQEVQSATEVRLAEARQRLDRVQEIESGYLELQGRRDMLLTRNRDLQREVERLTLNLALDTEQPASVRVLARASPPVLPTWPRRSLVVGLAAAFGLLLAIAYAVFAQFFDRSVSTEGDLRRVLGVPVLGRLPELPRLR
jgi:uncharacterized protein involved in exopolysaccharide biosynthesis